MQNRNDDRTYTELLGSILNDFVGHGKQLAVEKFAEDADVSTNVIYGLQQGTYRCSFDAAMRIVRVLPEEGAERFWNALGFTGLRRISGPRMSFRRAHAVITRASHVLAEYFVDGRVDHREEAEWERHHKPKLSAAIASMENER